MANLGMIVSPGFILLAAALYYIGGGGAVIAFFSAALAHELGHLTAMFLCGASPQGVRITASGPVLSYSGALTRNQEIYILLAGPGAGLLFSICCFIVDMPYFCYVGLISLLATAFNLLPVQPMDGGRLAGYMLEAVAPEQADVVMRIIGSMCALGVLITGVHIHSPAAAAAGIWMAVLANAPELR